MSAVSELQQQTEVKDRDKRRRHRWAWRFLGLCCASGLPEAETALPTDATGCHGHHSLYVQPEVGHSDDHTGVAVVYRPPQINERLAPGESRPRFWIKPGPSSAEPAVVSVAWCESCQHQPANNFLPEVQEPLTRDAMTSLTRDAMTSYSHPMTSYSHPMTSQRSPTASFTQPDAAFSRPPMTFRGHSENKGDSEHRGRPGHKGHADHTGQRSDGSHLVEKCMDGDFGLPVDDVMMSGDNNIVVKTYPSFLKPYINKIIRLKLNYTDPKTQQVIGAHNHLRHDRESLPIQETSHLVRTLHSLRMHLRYSATVRGLPEVVLEENHGGSKRLRKLRFRHMPVRWIDLDHRCPRIRAVGDAFELSLTRPCPKLTPDDFPDGNGEVPAVVGEYTRTLDTAPDRRLVFSVRLYQWYNQSTPSLCASDVSTFDIETGTFY